MNFGYIFEKDSTKEQTQNNVFMVAKSRVTMGQQRMRKDERSVVTGNESIYKALGRVLSKSA